MYHDGSWKGHIVLPGRLSGPPLGTAKTVLIKVYTGVRKRPAGIKKVKVIYTEDKLELFIYAVYKYIKYLMPQSTHRVAIATFWRTFHHDGKISPAW